MADVECLFAFKHNVFAPYTCVRHRHACTEVVFNIGGEGTLFHGAQTFEYGAQSVFTYQPGEEHWITQRRPGVHLCFGLKGCGAEDLRVGSFPVGPELRRLATMFQAALADGSSHGRNRLELIAGLITLHLKERFARRPEESHAHKARAIIERHYGEVLTIAEIARRLYISPDYLRQVFRKEFGVGPLHYLLQKRIDAATELLRFSTLRIQEIARQCGFDNPFYFSRQYRKFAGKAPSAMRSELTRKVKSNNRRRAAAAKGRKRNELARGARIVARARRPVPTPS